MILLNTKVVNQAMRILFPLIFLIGFAFHNPISAQQDQLIELLEQLKTELKTVETKTLTYKPTLIYKAEAPYQVSLFIDEVNKKGTKTKEYQLNLAYLTDRQIKRKSTKNLISVSIEANDKIIQRFEDGNLKNYNNEVQIPVTDVDHARGMVDLIQQTIPVAKASWEANIQMPDDYQGLQAFIIGQVKNVEVGSESFEQKLEAVDEERPRFKFTKTKSDNKGAAPTEQFLFNFADIHPPTVKTIVRGTAVYVEMQTDNRNKFIEEEKEGKQFYEDKLIFNANNFDEAQLLVMATRAFLELADAKDQAALPSLADNAEAMDYMLNNIPTSYKVDDANIRQEVKAGCLFEISRTSSTEKGDKNTRYIVDLSDLSANEIQIKVGGNGIEVQAQDDSKAKFIGVFEGEEQKNYTNKFEIGVESILNAKKVRYALSEAIKTCEKGVPAKDFDWMVSLLKDQATVDMVKKEQQFSKIDEQDCKLALTVIETTNKGSKTDNYEFNLKDLEEKATVLATQGNNAYIEAFTNYKERIITVIDDSGKQRYENSVQMLMPDIATGKTFLVTLKKLINSCK